MDDGTNTYGFGDSSGTAASNLPINNNFAMTSEFGPVYSAFNFESDLGALHLKGLGIVSEISYEVVPEPNSAMLLAIAGLLFVATGRRR